MLVFYFTQFHPITPRYFPFQQPRLSPLPLFTLFNYLQPYHSPSDASHPWESSAGVMQRTELTLCFMILIICRPQQSNCFLEEMLVEDRGEAAQLLKQVANWAWCPCSSRVRFFWEPYPHDSCFSRLLAMRYSWVHESPEPEVKFSVEINRELQINRSWDTATTPQVPWNYVPILSHDCNTS